MLRCRLKQCFFLAIVFIFVFLVVALVSVTFINDDFLMLTSSYMRDVKAAASNMEEVEMANDEPIKAPIILWWTTGLMKDSGTYKSCGDVECFFTVKRKYRQHPMLKVFMFYGTDVQVTDLPLPRAPHHEWAVIHEESPKNNVLFSYEDFLVLFNHTATFRRESDYPITTQFLISEQWLMSQEYMKSFHFKNQLQKDKGLAPIVYVHSDCDPPSDRDHYVKLLMKHIPVDSYGSCLNNKQLPKHLRDPVAGMEHKDFYEMLSQYKFALAMENAVCQDYVTEKLWRPLMLGVIPIVYGSPSVKDFLPSNHSAIVITDFKDVQSLAQFIRQLNTDETAYDKYRTWKKDGMDKSLLHQHLKHRDWSGDVSSDSIDFIHGFECFVCKRVHENLQRQKRGEKPLQHIANVNHYGCPVPRLFDETGNLGKESSWHYEWQYASKVSAALRWYVEHGIAFTKEELEERAKVRY